MIFNKSENNISQKKIDNFKKNQWKMNKIIDISETQFLPGHHTIFGGVCAFTQMSITLVSIGFFLFCKVVNVQKCCV